jgi:hypothetical protein
LGTAWSQVALFDAVLRERTVSLDDEIMARIRASTAWDKDSKLGDFQIKAGENGLVLINLKTRRAQLIYDEDSELRDLQELFPNLVFFPEQDDTSALPSLPRE